MGCVQGGKRAAGKPGRDGMGPQYVGPSGMPFSESGPQALPRTGRVGLAAGVRRKGIRWEGCRSVGVPGWGPELQVWAWGKIQR